MKWGNSQAMYFTFCGRLWRWCLDIILNRMGSRWWFTSTGLNDWTVWVHGFMVTWSWPYITTVDANIPLFNLRFLTPCLHRFFIYCHSCTILNIIITHRRPWFNITAIGSPVTDLRQQFLKIFYQLLLWQKKFEIVTFFATREEGQWIFPKL